MLQGGGYQKFIVQIQLLRRNAPLAEHPTARRVFGATVSTAGRLMTYTRARVAWSVVTREKWFSSMVRVPVSATWPQPQNNATPEKQRMVATREA